MQNSRQVTVYDPKTKQFTFIDTCFGTHHLNFAEDANNTLWLSNNLQNELALVGWVNTKMFWETRDAGQVAGLDTARRRHQRQRQARRLGRTQPAGRPAKDKRIGLGLYGIAYSPADGSIWGSNIGHPGWVIRMQPGSNPPETALAEVYKVPPPGFGMRGFDIDRQGVAWVTLASGHIASFDRRKCKGRLNGPGAAEGNLCPEGWTFYPLPGPSFAGRDGAAEGPYYTWVDQHDILGLGPNTPIGTGNFSDSLHALTYGKVVELRVPYPMGFFAKGVDGRIDDPNAGWKGKGLWVTSGQSNAHAHRRHRRAESRRAGQDAGEPAGRALPAAPRSARALEGLSDGLLGSYRQLRRGGAAIVGLVGFRHQERVIRADQQEVPADGSGRRDRHGGRPGEDAPAASPVTVR